MSEAMIALQRAEIVRLRSLLTAQARQREHARAIRRAQKEAWRQKQRAELWKARAVNGLRS